MKPLLTPLLLTVQTYFQPSISSDPVPTSPLISTIKGTTLVAVLSAFSLSNGDIFGSLISIILVASLFIVYSIFIPGFTVKVLPLSSVDIETNIKAIAGRTMVLLLIAVAFQTLVLGPPNSNIILVLFTGLVKALSWFFTIQAVRSRPVNQLIQTLTNQGTTNILVHSYHDRNLCYRLHQKSLLTNLSTSSLVSRRSLNTHPLSNKSTPPQTIQGQSSPLVLLIGVYYPLSLQRIHNPRRNILSIRRIHLSISSHRITSPRSKISLRKSVKKSISNVSSSSEAVQTAIRS